MVITAVGEVCTGARWGGLSAQGGQTQPPTENMDLRIYVFREHGASGVDPPLGAATLNEGSPIFTSADREWEFWIGLQWILPADKQKEENEETRKRESRDRS